MDVKCFAKQHKRVYDIRKACTDMASGRAPTRYTTITAEAWGDKIFELRRRSKKGRQVSRKGSIINRWTARLTLD